MPTWLIMLDRHFPIRYLTLLVVAAMLAGGGLAGWSLGWREEVGLGAAGADRGRGGGGHRGGDAGFEAEAADDAAEALGGEPGGQRVAVGVVGDEVFQRLGQRGVAGQGDELALRAAVAEVTNDEGEPHDCGRGVCGGKAFLAGAESTRRKRPEYTRLQHTAAANQ